MPERERRRSPWRRFLILYTILFLLLGAAGCYVLYRYAASYESSRPEGVMDELMAATSEDAWYTYVRDGADLAVSEFEDGEALFDAFFDTAVRGHALSYRKTPGEYSAEHPVYTVRSGGKDLCTVSLEPIGEGKAGFGRELWQVGEVRSCFSLSRLESVAVVIDAPPGEIVYLNGVALPETYLTGEQVEPPDLTELERRFDAPPFYERRRVEALYGAVTVTDRNGRALSPLREEPGTVRYVLAPETLYELTICAPEGATVLVGGAALDAREAAVEADPILDGLDAYTGGEAPHLLTWRYEGLYTEPAVTATDTEGRPLRAIIGDRGERRFFPESDTELQAEVEPRVRDFFDWYFEYAGSAYNVYRFNALLNAILPGTELYAYVRDSAEGMVWASATEITYDELVFDHFRRVGDRCFTCTVQCKASLSSTSWYESHTYEMESSYELAFVFEGWSWYAAAMSVLAG